MTRKADIEKGRLNSEGGCKGKDVIYIRYTVAEEYFRKRAVKAAESIRNLGTAVVPRALNGG